MKLTRVEGPAKVLPCAGCKREGIGGSEAYVSASAGEERLPEEWYADEDGTLYCAECSVKLVESDPTRSRSQFYADTAGTEILDV